MILWICNNWKKNAKNIMIKLCLIKINETLTPYARHRWIELNGIPEPGMRVHFKDCNPLNVEDDNLELRKGCSYSGLEIAKYNRFCREYIIKNKKRFF